ARAALPVSVPPPRVPGAGARPPRPRRRGRLSRHLPGPDRRRPGGPGDRRPAPGGAGPGGGGGGHARWPAAPAGERGWGRPRGRTAPTARSPAPWTTSWSAGPTAPPPTRWRWWSTTTTRAWARWC